MRRAGQGDDKVLGTTDETVDVFESGGEGEAAAEAELYDAGPPLPPYTPEPAAGPVPSQLALVPHAAPLPPISMSRIEPHASRDIKFQEVIRILVRRKWLIAAVLAVFVGLAAAYNHWATPLYEAEARVLVQPTSASVTPFRGADEDPGRLDYFLTQMEVLRSRELGRQVLEKLNLLSADANRQSEQVNALIGDLKVTPTQSELGETRVINVAYRSAKPDEAARIANAVVQTYVEDNLDRLRQASRDASKRLDDRLGELRREWAGAESAMAQYQESRGAVSLDDRRNVVVETLLKQNQQLVDARYDRMQKEANYNQLQTIQKAGGDLDTFPVVQQSQYIQQLKSEVATLQRKRNDLAEKLRDDHPDMQEANAALQNAQRRLKDETDKIVESVRNEFTTAQTRERGLQQDIESQTQRVFDLNRDSIQYGSLERQAASNKEVLEAVLKQAQETALTAELQSNNIRILDRAETPKAPVSPRTVLSYAIALLVGLFTALGVVFVVEQMHRRLADPDEIAGQLGLPLLGVTPQVAELRSRSAAVDGLPDHFQEAIRNIRTQILLSPASSGARTFAFTSARPGEGKTIISSSLAVSMAMAGRRVLLIDADLRRAQLCDVFHVPRAPGLSNVVAGELKPSHALVESSINGLYVLPAGDEMDNPGDLLDSQRLDQLMRGLRQVFDIVIIDAPPVMAVADAAIVASAASAVVFVVGSGTTSPEVAQLAIDRLMSVQARIVGVVLNKAKLTNRSEYYYPRQATQRA
jgi:capsular exopolysaccharide synthesis family protein